MPLLTAPKINLLSKRKAVFDQQSQVAFRVRVIAGVVLAVYAIVLLLVLGVNVYAKTQTDATLATEERLKMQLVSRTVLIDAQESLVRQAKVIQNLIARRRETVDLWKKTQQLIPPDCEMTLFSVDGDVLRVGVKSPHVLLANQAMDTIESQFVSIGATKMVATVVRADDASYQIDLELSLPQSARSN